jgi:hypothetical protein
MISTTAEFESLPSPYLKLLHPESCISVSFLFQDASTKYLTKLLIKNTNKNQSLDKRNKTRKNSSVPRMSMPPAPCPDTSRILSNYVIGVSFLAFIIGILSGEWEATRSTLPSLYIFNIEMLICLL